VSRVLPPPPVEFVRATVSREGQPGREWLGQLPATADRLAERWSLAPDGAPRYGYVATVWPVRRDDGTPAVLKVTWPGPDQAPEGAVLRAWAGDGAVRLLEHAPDEWGLLLERAHDVNLTGEPLAAAVTTIGRLLARLHTAPVPAELPRLATTAARWTEELPTGWSRLGWERRLLDQALDTCHALSGDVPDQVLHVDLHFENVLAADREPWLAIDPKGLAGDPAFESPAVLWNRVEEYAGPADVRRRLQLWCDAAGVDRERARRWAVVRTLEDAVDQAVEGSDDDRSQPPDLAGHRFLLDALAD